MTGGKSRLSWLTVALLAPTTAWFLVFLVMPLLVVVIFSLGDRAAAGGYAAAFTFDQYANLPSRLTAFRNTLTFAPLGTILSLLVAYPLAYYLAVKVDRRWRLLLLVLVIVPFWTSLLIRTYAWIFILGGRGIPTLLEFIGIEGVRLINTPTAVLVGIVYGYLPLMVFPIFVSLEKLDKRLAGSLERSRQHALSHLSSGDPAALHAGRGDRLHAGVHLADGRIPDSRDPRRRQDLLHR